MFCSYVVSTPSCYKYNNSIVSMLFCHTVAAATAVNLALESSRLKTKPQTSKQRLGKILGLDKSSTSSGWK